MPRTANATPTIPRPIAAYNAQFGSCVDGSAGLGATVVVVVGAAVEVVAAPVVVGAPVVELAGTVVGTTTLAAIENG